MTTSMHLPRARVVGDVIELVLPAAGDFAGLPRTVATSLAARLDFTLDEIDDLRIAVSEVCAILTDAAPPGAQMRCTFSLQEQTIVLTASAPSTLGVPADTDTFAWTVLQAVTDHVESRCDDGTLCLSLRKQRLDGEACA